MFFFQFFLRRFMIFKKVRKRLFRCFTGLKLPIEFFLKENFPHSLMIWHFVNFSIPKLTTFEKLAQKETRSKNLYQNLTRFKTIDSKFEASQKTWFKSFFFSPDFCFPENAVVPFSTFFWCKFTHETGFLKTVFPTDIKLPKIIFVSKLDAL